MNIPLWQNTVWDTAFLAVSVAGGFRLTHTVSYNHISDAVLSTLVAVTTSTSAVSLVDGCPSVRHAIFFRSLMLTNLTVRLLSHPCRVTPGEVDSLEGVGSLLSFRTPISSPPEALTFLLSLSSHANLSSST